MIEGHFGVLIAKQYDGRAAENILVMAWGGDAAPSDSQLKTLAFIQNENKEVTINQ